MLSFAALTLFFGQGALMLVDEIFFHRKRTLGGWEALGHPLDSILYAVPLALAAFAPTRGAFLSAYICLAVVSCLFVTKDEWVHAAECEPREHWIHSMLFILHPSILWAVGILWLREEGAGVRVALPFLVVGYAFFQVMVSFRRRSLTKNVNNSFYDDLGDRWYTDDRHAVALLRAESHQKLKYVKEVFEKNKVARGSRILDIGCGAGFIANPLAGEGFKVKGIDLADNALETAREHAPAGSLAEYEAQNAYELKEATGAWDIVLMLDFLEHVDNPDQAIQEASRVLKPGGLLIMHTFNRNWLAGFLAIDGISLLTRDCPVHLHVYSLFLKPREVVAFAKASGLRGLELRGMRPDFFSGPFWWSLFHRRIHPDFRFTFSRSLVAAYLGCFEKLH